MFLSPVRPAPVGAEGSVTEKTPSIQNGHNLTVNFGHGETITADPIFDEDLRARKGVECRGQKRLLQTSKTNPETQLLRLAEGNCLCFHC